MSWDHRATFRVQTTDRHLNGKINCCWPDCYLGAALSYLRLLCQGRLFPHYYGKTCPRLASALCKSTKRCAMTSCNDKRINAFSPLCESQHLPYANHERLSEDKVITSYVYSMSYYYYRCTIVHSSRILREHTIRPTIDAFFIWNAINNELYDSQKGSCIDFGRRLNRVECNCDSSSRIQS
jgi:hypothetical protein